MEDKTEIINNDNQPIIKVKKPVSEAQKEAQKRYYLKIKSIWNAQEYQAKNIMTVIKRRF